MIDRRTVLTAALTAFAGLALRRNAQAQAGMSRMTAYAFSFAGLAGGNISLADYAGRPILIVNTASLCGFTPQYAGLQELWTEFSKRGLMIIGNHNSYHLGEFAGLRQVMGSWPEIRR